MSYIDLFIWAILLGLIIYNLMLLKRVRIIFKSYSALFDHKILMALALLLLLLAGALVISLVLILM